MTAMVEAYAARLADASLDAKARLNVVTELRDSVELHQVTADYPLFVEHVLPAILKLLHTIPMSMDTNSSDQKLRKALLDVITRIQMNAVLRPAAPELLQLVMDILRVDNEENGLLCMKIFTNLQKSYARDLQEQVPQFFNFVTEVFRNVPNLVDELFNQPPLDSGASASTAPSAGSSGGNSGSVTPALGLSVGTGGAASGGATGHDQAPMLKAMYSFKVLAECPIIIVLLYASHKDLVNESLPDFVPHVIETLTITAAPQAREHSAADSRGDIYTGVSPAIRQRAAYNDFIVAQIKIMSFLAYVLKTLPETLNKYLNLVPTFVVRLLKDCPPELTGGRKELLVSMRHILGTNYRTYFIPKVDILFEERVLIGAGLTAQETLRPLAYTTMADLMHHIRGELSVVQIWKAVHVYTRDIRDRTLSPTFQLMSAKLLMNFMDRMDALPDRQEGRQIMLVIFRTLLDRFTEYNHEQADALPISPSKPDVKTSMSEVLKTTVIKIHPDAPSDAKDSRFILKHLLSFIRDIMVGFRKSNPPPPYGGADGAAWNDLARGFSYNDVYLLRRLLRESIIGLQRYFGHSVPTNANDKLESMLNSSSLATSKEETELMTAVAVVYMSLDPATFLEVMELEIDFVYEAMFQNPSLLHFLQLFGGRESTSPNILSVLLRFLKRKQPELGDGDTRKSQILINMYRQAFLFVSVWPDLNEAVILPHFKDLIVQFLNPGPNVKDPMVHFHLLRTLFRSIGGHRFESLYKAVLPVIQVVLETLNRRLDMARKSVERDLYVELALKVPIRLTLLVPHIPLLIRPLVLALNGNQELVIQGLRTLELCVDNLTASYFDPILEPVIDELMSALWKHLRPKPYNHVISHTTLRILGKLGGRNRAFLYAPKDLKALSAMDQDMTVLSSFEGLRDELPIKLTPGILHALKVLENPLSKDHYRSHAFDYLSVVLLQFIDKNEVKDIKLYAETVRKSIETSEFDTEPLQDGSSKDYSKRTLATELCKRILEAIFFAVSLAPLKERASKLLTELCEHFTLLEVGEFTIEKRRAMRNFGLDDREGIPTIEARAILPAILYALSHYNEEVREQGIRSVQVIYETGKTICGPGVEVYRYPMIRSVFSEFSHGCFDDAYYRKAGAILGLRYLVQDLDISLTWLRARQVELVRTIFFVIKDVSSDVPASVRDNASDLLYHLIDKCNKDITTEEQISTRPFTLLSSLLAYELASANPPVRDTSKQALRKLSEVVGIPLSKIMENVTSTFLGPIFRKPLRALPFPVQIGYVDAICFSFELPDTFLQFNDELVRLLEEALALVDAEDDSLTSAPRVLEYTTSQQLIELRVVCIKLLALAATQSDYLSVSQPQMRAKIITVFFKTLSSSATRTVDAAHDALKAVLSQNAKLPKELLQSSLRPILVNLSDHSRLSVQGLDSLARLLGLLTSYFKVEIGSKLLDHARAWTEPSKLLSYANKDLSGDQGPIAITTGIFNVFHLLPPNAEVYIPDVVAIMSYIETTLRRVRTSPFRVPVLKFLEAHVAHAFNFFLSKFTDSRYGHLFVDFLSMPEAEKLRDYTRQNIDQLRQEIRNHERAEDKCVGICNLIFILRPLLADREWLRMQQSVILNLVKTMADVARTTASFPTVSTLHMEVESAVEEFQFVVREYVLASMEVSENGLGDINMMMSLIDSIGRAGMNYCWSLIDYFYQSVVTSDDVELRCEYLRAAIELMDKESTVESAKLFLITTVIRPTLIVEIRRKDSLSALATKFGSGGWLDGLRKFWVQPVEQAYTIDRYQFGLLELTALLIKYARNNISDARKDVIKYGWNFVKYDDIVSKLSAYVVVSYFIASYDTLVKMVVQAYRTILKARQPESKTLVVQALDILAPHLPRVIGKPMWAKIPRLVLGEEGHNVMNVTNIYLFISRHPDLFYEFREHFVPFIVSAMGKMSYMPTVHTDIDLAEVLATWVKRASEEKLLAEATRNENGEATTDKVQESAEDMDLADDTTEANEVRETPSHDARMLLVHRDAVITYLVRYVCTLQQRATESPYGKRVLTVLDTLLAPGNWDDVEVRLNFFDRSLMQSDFTTQATVVTGLNALAIMRIALSYKPSQWIKDNLDNLSSLLERGLRSASFEIHQAAAPVIGIIFQAIDPEEAESQALLRMVTGAIQEHLGAMPPALGWVALTEQVAKFHEPSIYPLMPFAIKALSRASKELSDALMAQTAEQQAAGSRRPPGPATAANAPAAASASSTNAEAGATTTSSAPVQPATIPILVSMLDLIGGRISHLGDQRRVFLSCVLQIVERINDTKLSLHIIGMVRDWVFSKTDLFPTVKEKALLIQKLLHVVDKDRDTELVKAFYSVVVGVFEDEALVKTELPARLEQSFLVGTTLGANEVEVEIRNRLLSILSDSLEPNILKRLGYVFTEQSWESLSDHYWLNEVLQLIYKCGHLDAPLRLGGNEFTFSSMSVIGIPLTNQKAGSLVADDEDVVMEDGAGPRDGEMDKLVALVERRSSFIRSAADVKLGAFLRPLSELQYQSADLTHEIWVSVFPALYKYVPAKDRHELVQSIVVLLAKEYHNRQADLRPNVVYSILEGIAQVEHLPPQLVKFLAGNFGAWYPGIQILENIQSSPATDSTRVVESNLDALAEMYTMLQDNDMFYGVWRTRSKFIVTNSALSYEQCGMWNRAMQMHETAQVKARSGVLPYGESEYALWEDHWILCAEKLQHWDILTELARHEGFSDLLLECGWRVADWIADKEPFELSIKSLMDVPTPRRQVFETFLTLQGFAQKTESLSSLSKSCDEGIQLALRKWHGLPRRITGAHIPLLHTFQQYVEFMEASHVYTSLHSTTHTNLEHKSQELKSVLHAWHERLPNQWDDINIWSDLATWRQHVFGVINKVYLPLIQPQSASNSTSANSAAYRGYHEIAWVINRFAHVARKQQMIDVCVQLLAKIYTLPNIEIQEAFLKLREQAKCHYQNANDVSTGLEVISNTNFAFFAAQQKSEFFTLRGMSLAKLGADDAANEQFATAVQLDVYLPKAWAEWGRFNDRRFKEHPEDMTFGSTAVSCYLQAAGLYKNAKARKLLGRILWLLSLDDASGTISSGFASYRGDVPVWFWVTYIPQLLVSLNQREARFTSRLLVKIAKSFPQALHYHLRTSREEYAVLQRQVAAQNAAGAPRHQGPVGTAVNAPQSGANDSANSPMSSALGTNSPAIAHAALGGGHAGVTSTPHASPSISSNGNAPGSAGSNGSTNTNATGGAGASSSAGNGSNGIGTGNADGGLPEDSKRPWEYVDEITNVLKTGYPLLALSLETMVDQIFHRFKSYPDEDAYRLVVALLNDAMYYMGRMPVPKEDAKLPQATEANILRFADNVVPKHVKPAFEADFVHDKPDLETYIKRLRKWRDRFEAKLDARPSRINLEALAPPLSEFHHQKFEEVEVPGQNQELRDSNVHFVKIGRFLSNVYIARGFGACYRRLTIRGHDGSTHAFQVQHPVARHYRREEQTTQLFKILNGVIGRRKETRQRNIRFTLPTAVPLNTHVRLVQDNVNYVTFYQIYDKFCKARGQSRDAPFDFMVSKMRAAYDPRLPKPEIVATRMEILGGIQSTLVPPTVMRDYFLSQYRSYEDFWLFRKQFAYQYAGVSFLTIMMCINSRYPHKFSVDMASGNIWASELLPNVAHNKNPPTLVNNEPVSVRLTPNIQTLLGPTTMEGLYAMAIMVIAKGLTEPEFDLAQYLPVFVRDELLSWFTQQPQGRRPETHQLREVVMANVDSITKRTTSLAQIGQGNIPANQTVIDLISMAVNPRNLALSDVLWMPYF